MSYVLVKHAHILLAVLTLTGFIIRGAWMLIESHHLRHPVARILPHVVDTVFLVSGIAMLVMASLNPLTQNWLLAKFAGLILYVLLGTIAIRRGPSLEARRMAFVAALCAFGYVVGVALSKSPASWLACVA